ncbi:cryptochrome photoreceptor [Thecamonas trahens ATCC 50062]|uniref:Cryptochrome photoreceptor n=1 Tax=Thecamonas trahens ATCC 50062 TaxID=461836 RepID=A0A0L0DNG2_THETB|nr:cryptochrome photoreceptor [Thecamonas trahens ATCC 50062]KNC53852.1 cryptochrome photoreceptor [Thecamonas trahens ATCC 50062]|eukprot:XP_013754232.1 cryptochrome photoreceptor [Thecamonas trahens ATCC 50062]
MAARMGSRQVAMVWFRKALRVDDNPALAAAADAAAAVVPVFVLDPHLLTRAYVGDTRLVFLLESLLALDSSLRALGSQLLVIKGTPEKGALDTLQALWREVGADSLHFEADYEPYAKIRDAKATRMAADDKLAVETSEPNLIYPMEVWESVPDAALPTTFGGMRKLIAKRGWQPQAPIEAPTELPPLPQAAVDAVAKDTERFAVPGMAAFPGRSEGDGSSRAFPGGEAEAQERMRAFLADVDRVVTFEKPKTNPFAEPPSTTGLSAHLKFGTLSVRRFYEQLRAVEEKSKRSVSQPPVSLVGQVLWREFYTVVGSRTPGYEAMATNPLSRIIPWDDEPDKVAAWAEGRTGFPLIDAVMRQLRATGWVHHLARHLVACFLTRGYLWQSWEAGAGVFNSLLLDADHYLNIGNWLWLSASAFFHQYWRVYSPISFGNKYGASAHAYVRRWVPELARLPDKHLMAPFDAPEDVLADAGVVLGRDYPEPIVDHAAAKTANLTKMKAAYAAKRRGDPSAAAGGNDAGSSAAAVGSKRRVSGAEGEPAGKRAKA